MSKTIEDLQIEFSTVVTQEAADTMMQELEEIGTPAAKAMWHVVAARMPGINGDQEGACTSLQQALTMYTDIGDEIGKMVVLNAIGVTHYYRGGFSDALDAWLRCLAIAKATDSKQHVAIAYAHIGNAYLSNNDSAHGLEYHTKALDLHQALNDRSSVALTLGNISYAYLTLKDFDSALSFQKRGRDLFFELGDHSSVAYNSLNICDILLHQLQFDESAALFDSIQRDHLDDQRSQMMYLNVQGKVETARKNFEVAESALLQGLEESSRLHLRHLECSFLESLRDLALAMSDLPGYVQYNQRYVALNEELTGRESTVRMAMQEKQLEIEAHQREHDKQLAILYSTLPKHVADRLVRGENVNDQFEEASVLFLDLVGFTEASGDRSPSEVVGLLESVFRRFDLICKAKGVIKVKTIGDAYLAFAADVEHQSRITRVALEMLHHLQREGNMSARVGLHCGPLIAGVVGTDRLQYDVWGDTVNTASRMESNGAAGKVNVSHQLYQAIAHHPEFTFEARGLVEVKGKGLVEMYFVSAGSAAMN